MPRDTITPEQAARQLLTARREASEAAALADQLADRVRDGDDTVTAEQLNSQRQLAELAELRITAAERKLNAARTVDLDARARTLADRIGELVDADSTEEISAAALDAYKAIRRLMDLTKDRDETIRAVASEVVQINTELMKTRRNDPWPTRTLYGFSGQERPLPSITRIGKGRVDPVRPGRVLGAVIAAALVDQPTVRTHVNETVRGADDHVAPLLSGLPSLLDALRYDRQTWNELPERVRAAAYRQGRRPLPQDSEG
ncbi:hypothetical protein [Streptomyces sp. NPDC048663]|uniref:hypothetical protein n=1 Tax=Streptomyces sp. NPDC048663 TaxID=3155638 RepID=UPI003427E774